MQNLNNLPLSMERSLTEPPLIKEISTEELNKFSKNLLTIRIPCHTQGVEGCIKMVTEASQQVYGEEIPGMVTSGLKSNLVPNSSI